MTWNLFSLSPLPPSQPSPLPLPLCPLGTLDHRERSDIGKGEELTYDYVPEAARKKKTAKRGGDGVKCLCGMAACRNYIW